MGKKLPSPASDSSLSPVADDLILQVESKAEVKSASNGKKRKANAADVKITTRTKKAKGLIEKGMGHDESVGKEDSDGKAKFTKKKTTTTTTTTTSKKKQVDLAPLAERTRDTSLLVGAHVSTAGG
jgi:AP endonuclease 1